MNFTFSPIDFFRNIKFWLVFFFVIRLYGITNPPTEISHNWRQCQTSMVNRNFNNNCNILYPELDTEGGKKIAMEFPIFNYLIFLFNKIFGYTHWYGRLINLCITTFGMYFFYRVLKVIHTSKTAFYGTLILTVSVFFSFGRKIMPHTFSPSLVFAGVFFAYQFIRSDKIIKNFYFIVLSLMFLVFGTLSMITSLIFFVFLLIPLRESSVSLSKKIVLSITIILSVAISMLWYGWWNFELVRNGASKIIFPSTLADGLNYTLQHLPGVLEKFYFSAFYGYITFIVFVLGLIFVLIKKEKKILLVFVTGFLLFVIFILKSSSFFYYHNYYIIPFAPFMALVAGFGISQIKNEFGKSVLMILAISESILNQQHGFKNKEDMEYKTNLEVLMNKYCGPGEKIFINTGPNPQQLYFANRKGWLLDKPEIISKFVLDSISSRSYSIVVLDKKIHTKFKDNEFISIFNDENYIFLKPRD